MVGGLLTICTGDNQGAWSCWSVVPAMLEALGAFKRNLTSALPLLEVSTAGFRYCGLRQDGQVVCMESNSSTPQLTAVEGLPD
jgi:hypothetical protein